MAAFLATIINGKPDFGSDANKARFMDWCKEHEGAKLRIEEPKATRTLDQNGLYWAWLENVAAHTGNDAEDLHELLKLKLLPRRFITVKGNKKAHNLQVPKSTRQLSKTEFGEYLDKCAAFTGYPLPTPEQLEAMGYIRN